MNERAIEKGWHYGQLAFMAVVTACLLTFVFEQAANGFGSVAGMVVWSFAAGFGLEFVCSSWSGRAGGPGRRRSVHHQ
jgi:hypothetical protein